MKIYLDTDKVLHIDERTYKSLMPLIFVDQSPNSFDILDANTGNSIIGERFDITKNKAENLAGIYYASIKEIYDAIKLNWIGETVAVGNGEYDATLSDTVDLTRPGWIQASAAGTVKYTTVEGDVRTRALDAKEITPVRVKRVWLNGTTVGMGIVVIS